MSVIGSPRPPDSRSPFRSALLLGVGLFAIVSWPTLVRAASTEPSSVRDLIETARQQRLYNDPQWLKLGHYRRSVLGGYRSQVDGREFFLSPQGRRSPQRELEATLSAFFTPDPPDPKVQHPQCQFPARYAWLKSKLAFDSDRLQEKHCPGYEAFRERVAARSVTLVFSSYYLNNPSSAFGHTLLRLNRADPGAEHARFDLIDFGIEYAATVDTANALVYAFKGLTGGFRGHFTHWPYYYKVRQYNDFEKRDIWEYDLNLEARHVSMLVAHLWELGSTYFDYYYLTENCSYHVLTALEAANPELELASRLPFYVIPADTVKALYANPGLVRQVRYRPSIWTQFGHRMARLTAAQKKTLQKLLADPEAPIPPELRPDEKAQVLDAALDYMDARYAAALLKGVASPVGRKQRLLERRSEIRTASSELAIETPAREMPHIGHGSMRTGFASGYSDRLGFYEQLGLRFALHDLLDPQTGYPEHAQIEFLATRLRYNVERRSLWLDDFALFRVVSLSPIDAFNRQLSWNVEAGAKTVRDKSCKDCLAGTFRVGAGIAQSFFEGPRLTYFLTGDVEAAVSPGFNNGDGRLAVGPTAGVHLRLGEHFSGLATGSWSYLAFVEPEHSYEFGVINRWHITRAISLTAEGRRYPTAWEGALGILVYF